MSKVTSSSVRPARAGPPKRAGGQRALDDAIQELAHCLKRNGCVRFQNPDRLANEGWMRYKKGDEVRFVASSEEELQRLQRSLQVAGFRPGRPYAKGRQFCLPLYGREAVGRLMRLVECKDHTGPAC